jgi:hypothetical protein
VITGTKEAIDNGKKIVREPKRDLQPIENSNPYLLRDLAVEKEVIFSFRFTPTQWTKVFIASRNYHTRNQIAFCRNPIVEGLLNKTNDL